MHLALQIIELLYFFYALANVDRAGAVMRLDGGSEEKGDLERHDLNYPGGDIFALKRRY
jgi:hypothetical protein